MVECAVLSYVLTGLSSQGYNVVPPLMMQSEIGFSAFVRHRNCMVDYQRKARALFQLQLVNDVSTSIKINQLGTWNITRKLTVSFHRTRA